MDRSDSVKACWLSIDSALGKGILKLLALAHLVSCSTAPFNHLRDGLCVQAFAGLSDGVDDCGIGLQRVQGGHGILALIQRGYLLCREEHTLYVRPMLTAVEK